MSASGDQQLESRYSFLNWMSPNVLPELSRIKTKTARGVSTGPKATSAPLVSYASAAARASATSKAMCFVPWMYKSAVGSRRYAGMGLPPTTSNNSM
jgi:hypothetical protein